jgi:hypothetical protein
MKRKMKKFNEGGKTYDKEDEGILGGKIKYREDDEGRKFVAGKANPMDRNPSEQRYYSKDDVKKGLSNVGDKISNFFGGKKEDSSSKFDELESVGGAGRRPRTIQEQIGGKSEEAPIRKMTDRMINKPEPAGERQPSGGRLFVNQEANKSEDEKPAKQATPTVKKAASASKATDKVGKGYEDVTRALRGSEKVGKGYENLDPRSPQEKSRGKKQGVIQYEKGRSMSDWSRNLGKKPEPVEDDEEDKAPKGVNIGAARGRKKGGVIRSASARADGCAIRGKTRA